MYTVIIILTVLVAILLIAVVLVQKSKGGGLASNFSGSNQIMGVRRTNDFIEKATWTLAGVIALLAIISTFVMPNSVANSGPRVKAAAAPVVTGTEYNTQAPVLPIEQPATADEAPAPAAEEAPAAE
ncbi:MAG: preprotein translocase subunit SecG [Muribaculaceae bacterium]|nr:preprotein translocase subunit SecG [Muribaculaceae bacterium]MDE5857977.1 preprotein translocase subunit SecG [Muribaculaceae bacterium]MDE7368507.1 preprotein translocase subunit SecG [Muribaculaceae bacterium]